MKINWNEQTVRWFREASEYTGYNKKLAALLLEHMADGGTLCDIGCGAGLIDMELSPRFSKVTCVDIDADAVEAVRREADRRGLLNITAVQSDGKALAGEWDTVIALFHGGDDVINGRYLDLARDRLIFLVHGSRVGNVGPEGRRVVKCSDTASTRAALDARGVKYELVEAAIEYGQPLRSMEEAEAYTRTYTEPMPPETLAAYLKERLESTGDAEFPLYLPNLKRFGMFVIRRDENENLQR